MSTKILLPRVMAVFLSIGALPVLTAVAQTDATGVSFVNGVEVRVNGSASLHFGLDTGAAPAFFITPEHAQELALPVIGQRVIHTSDKQTTSASEAADVVHATTLQIDGYSFPEPEGVVQADKHHDGTLGISLFKDVLLGLNYPQDKLTITVGALPTPNERDVIAYTTNPESSFAPLRVSPTVSLQLAGRSFLALLDTGARRLSADVIMPTSIAMTLPLGATESETMITGSSGRSFPAHTAKLNGKLVLGSLILENPTIMVTDWLGFVDIGRVINCLALTIDQRNQRLRIEVPRPSACAQNRAATDAAGVPARSKEH